MYGNKYTAIYVPKGCFIQFICGSKPQLTNLEIDKGGKLSRPLVRIQNAETSYFLPCKWDFIVHPDNILCWSEILVEQTQCFLYKGFGKSATFFRENSIP